MANSSPDTDEGTPRLSGSRLGERYILGELVSKGGMGAVYEGVQVDLGRRVAIKVLHADGRDDQAQLRFEQEASVLAGLSHPHIVSVIDYGTDPDGFPFLVMEYIEGQPLSKLLESEARLPVGRAMRFTRHVLAALSASHRIGLVHRDVKPENIMLTQVPALGEFAKVIDFGIALQAAGEIGVEGQTLGTPAFMAPEQLMHEGVDERVDIWAVGVILYRMLTGAMPFGDPSGAEFLTRVMTGEPAPIPEALCPPSLQAVLWRALSKDPADRFQSADAFLQALTEAEAAVEPATPATPAGDSPRRLRGIATALAVVSVLAIALALRVSTPRADPAPSERADVTPESSDPEPEVAEPPNAEPPPETVPEVEVVEAPPTERVTPARRRFPPSPSAEEELRQVRSRCHTECAQVLFECQREHGHSGREGMRCHQAFSRCGQGCTRAQR